MHYSLFDLIELTDELTDALAAPVDLVTMRALNPHIKEDVLHTLIPIYDRR